MTSTQTARPPRYPALRDPVFRRLTAAWVASNLGDSLLFIVAAVWVKELTGSDALAGGVFVAYGLAAFTAPFLGQLADRMRRVPLLVVANLAAAAVLAALFLVDAERVWIVHIVLFLYGAVGYLTSAAQSGLVRDLVADDDLAGANGLLATIDQAARLVAPLVGTGLYVLVGAQPVIAIALVSFLVAAGVFRFLGAAESEPEPPAEREPFRAEISAGVRLLFGDRRLGILTVVLAVAFAATGLTNVVVFPALEQGFDLAPAWLGVVTTFQGLGALAGGLTVAPIVARLGESRTVAIGVAVLGVGLLSLLGGWQRFVPVVVGLPVASAAIGLAVTWAIVAYVTVRQRSTPARLQGRTAAASNVLLNVPQTIAMVAGTALILAVDYRLLVVVTGAVILLAAAACLVAARSR
ncbi:MFS transporter [Agromyces seonyuensis]|uniref:MFS transporter n=1 Tax=Agromyces seonyuensis TaxID=2662446 RepID=A0A6I4P316_9MICO|nr:MFS transporter [Agromyces seonyuensis]MWC00053.1 MFS transporter [Agromyces seonyuensis]